MKNIVIWFIGSNASGKTTQAALLHKFLSDYDFPAKFCRGETNGTKWCYTQLSPSSSNLGKFSHPYLQDLFPEPITVNDCCGTDNLAGKDSVIASFEEACKSTTIVVVEGIMATAQWINFLKREDNIVLLVHLKMDLEYNLQQLTVRKQSKNPEFDGIYTDKTRKNINGKINGFKSLYSKMQNQVDSAIEIDARLSKTVIHVEIIEFLSKAAAVIS